MKKFNVESRRNYKEIFDNYVDNYVCDYILAETEEDAIELYKEFLVENGCDPEEVEEYEYQAKEVER